MLKEENSYVQKGDRVVSS